MEPRDYIIIVVMMWIVGLYAARPKIKTFWNMVKNKK